MNWGTSERPWSNAAALTTKMMSATVSRMIPVASLVTGFDMVLSFGRKSKASSGRLQASLPIVVFPEAKRETIIDLRGTMIKERMDIPSGSFAAVADSQGARFALWQEAGACPND